MMKKLHLLLAFVISASLLTSCVVVDDGYDNELTLEQIISAQDIWYVDFNRTTGNGDVPFLSNAFTITFNNGRLYANNNLVGLGSTGGGLGLQIGFYDTRNGYLEIDHDYDGYYDLEVIRVNYQEIIIRDNYSNTSYYLEGYRLNNFDFDLVFYDNIEYFLQEYIAWEKTNTSISGAFNDFDNENFLQFTPENVTTFRSSQDDFGTNIDNIYWDYIGSYEVFDVSGYDNLKILTLDYDSYGNEEFELTVNNDGEISLYHNASGTTYRFNGRGNLQYKNEEEKGSKPELRKRFKIERDTKTRNTKV